MASQFFHFRISPDLKATIAQASAEQGKTPSDFGREAVIKLLSELKKPVAV